MLRSVIISPDRELTQQLRHILEEWTAVHVLRNADYYPDEADVRRLLRAHAPEVVFLDVEIPDRAIKVARYVEHDSPRVQIVAFSRCCEQNVLLETMRMGVREFLPVPFEHASVMAALERVQDLLKERPPHYDMSNQVFAFLPSKAGVGTSTIALNVSAALATQPGVNVLLTDLDLNSGMIRFMLKLENSYSLVDASEHASQMDETVWPKLVTTLDRLDVLHAGRINPSFRIESAMRPLVDFMRRNYKVLCFDLSGNLERYSLDVIRECRKVFLVCTPEIASLHQAREKHTFLTDQGLNEQVSVLVNRCQKRPMITNQEIEELLGMPIYMTLPNDYQGVSRAMMRGTYVDFTSELGRRFLSLGKAILEDRPPQRADQKKKFLELFSVNQPYALSDVKKPAAG